jgi:peroxiredoxin
MHTGRTVTVFLAVAGAALVWTGVQYSRPAPEPGDRGSAPAERATVRFFRNPATVQPFTAADLDGRSVSTANLRGKVVIVNFWATWCPPCRKEMPDLEAIYTQFSSQGFVILGISDDEPDKVRQFVQQHGVTYPVLLDPGSKVNKLLHIQGIPKTFIYDREGKIVAESIDMRTQKQFLEMLAVAGLK